MIKQTIAICARAEGSVRLYLIDVLLGRVNASPLTKRLHDDRTAWTVVVVCLCHVCGSARVRAARIEV